MPSTTTARAAAWAPVATCWLGYVAIGIGFNVLGPVLPALRSDLHTGYAGLALLFAAGSLGSTLATLVGNRLLDRLRYRRTLILAGVMYGAALSVRYLSHSLPVWAGLSLIGGFAGSGIDIAGARYVAAAPGEGRSRALNLLNVFYSVGGLTAPLLVGGLALAGADVLWAYVASGLIGLGTAALAAAYMPEVRPRAGEGTAVAGWRWALGQPALVRLAVAIGLYAGVEVAFAGWVASYAQSRDHLTVAAAAVFPLLFWVSMTVGRSLASERARHWSERRLVALGVGLAVIGGLLVLVVPWPVALAAGAALAGLGCAPIFPTVFALAARRAPERHSEAYALLFSAASAGVLLMPWLAGQLFALAGATAAIAVPVAGAVSMAAVLAHAFLRDRDVRAEAARA